MRRFAVGVVALALLAGVVVMIASSPRMPADFRATWSRTGNLAPDRTRAAALFLPSPTCKVLLYGGAGPNGVPTGETFLYAPATDEWVQLPQQKGTTAPLAVTFTGLTWDSTQGLAVLFGGYSGGFATNRVSVFDSKTSKWSGVENRRCTASTCPGARYGHAQVWSSTLQETLVFGGASNATSPIHAYGDLWALKASRAPKGGLIWSWRQIKLPSLAPSPRYHHGMAEIPAGPYEHKILIYGGLSRTESGSAIHFEDTWLYDPASNTFEEIVAGRPTPRFGFAMAYSDELGTILINGGSNGSAFTDETWAFDETLRTWERVDTGPESPVPAARFGHKMASDPSGFCGDRGAYIVEAPVNYGGSDVSWFLERQQ